MDPTTPKSRRAPPIPDPGQRAEASGVSGIGAQGTRPGGSVAFDVALPAEPRTTVLGLRVPGCEF